MYKVASLLAVVFLMFSCGGSEKTGDPPNIILIMADDLGWQDVGFNGNDIIKTPNLDRLAGEGLIFDRFYSASAVCSPTRGSCLTGRHPQRYGIFHANSGHLPKEEITVPELLKTRGYTSGHFGKWHLGTLTTTEKDANRGGPEGAVHFSPPGWHGYEESFVTESKVPTYDPMRKPPNADQFCWRPLESADSAVSYGTAYWDYNLQRIDDNLQGDDSRVIMDRVLSFIDQTVENKQPFFASIWFHAPHLPVVASSEHLDLYAGHNLYSASYFGCITALDEQVGRLYDKLVSLGLSDRTMLWFCSDNGPEGQRNGVEYPGNGERPAQIASPGSAGIYRGRKRDLYEGGIRVPAFVHWPQGLKGGRRTSFPAVTSDYLPTIIDYMGIDYPDARLLDGISLQKAINGDVLEREQPIFFHFQNKMAVSFKTKKLISVDKGSNWEFYDIEDDPGETMNLAANNLETVEILKAKLLDWVSGCEQSREGIDYRLPEK